jgi:hypothetical protein
VSMRPADTTPAITYHVDSINHTEQQSTCKVPSSLHSVAAAINISYAMHNRTNGSTVSLINGSMAGKNLFAVSIYPARKIEFWERPSWQELFEFAKANMDLLLKPDHALGTWFNDWECVHVVDVVVCISDRDAALGLGLRAEKEAVFDIEARREIPIPLPHQRFNTNQHAGGAQ